MLREYEKVKLLVSRVYYHGGDGLEDMGLSFFRSMEEYEAQAEEQERKSSGESFKIRWCTPPKLLEVMVSPKAFREFVGGKGQLKMSDVLVPIADATKVHRIGGLHN